MRRTEKYAAMTKDEAERSRWTFYEAVNLLSGIVEEGQINQPDEGMKFLPSKP
jgi:hypothetical protein